MSSIPKGSFPSTTYPTATEGGTRFWCAGDHLTREELIRSWMAFKALYAKKSLVLGFSGQEFLAARAAGWEIGTDNQKYVDRMLADPWDFYVGYEFGVDIMRGLGGIVHPKALPAILAKESGADLRALFLEGEVALWSARLAESAEHHPRSILARHQPPTPAPQHQDPAIQHVTVEATKKTIKAQFVLASLLFFAGAAVLIIGIDGRRDLGLWMIGGAILWEVSLRVRRWWEHG
jgi:hypothetical protein